MNSGCGRQFCSTCGAELIHRDDRAWFEAASTLLAIIHRCGPVELTVGDIDAYLCKRLHGRMLLRLGEHKQPHQSLKPSQKAVLWCLDELFRHYMESPPSDPPFVLDVRSGVYVMRGHVAGRRSGARETHFNGPQTVTRVSANHRESLPDQEAVFAWLEGVAGGARRANGRVPPSEIHDEKETA